MAAQPTVPNPTSTPRHQRRPFRRFLDTILLALCIVLVFRALIVEPYGVPTGSMAPTLFGLNKAVICPRCGYTVRVGVGGDTDHTAGAFCPNCGCRDLGWDNAPIFSGDHLLVNKNVYDFRSPRRWEMTVFHSPLGDSRNFLKRVVGLPGESVQLHEGDVYVNNELARKTLAELKSLRIPVFDNNYQPAGIGWSQRWLTQPDRGAVPHDGPNLRLEGEGISDAYQWLVYRHTRGISGEESPVADEYAYNGGDRATKAEPVHDFLIECDLEIRSGDGWLALGVNDGGSEIVAELPVGAIREGTHLSEWPLGEGTPLTYRTAPTFGLHSGATYHMELAFADRRASLAVDGREVFAALDRPPLPQRAAVKRPARIGVRGVEVMVRNFRLFRDVHYTALGQHASRTPVLLGAGQYFVLGDNSPNSDDNRFWSDSAGRPIPVPETSFLGKPFLLHQPSPLPGPHPDWDRVHWLR